MHEASIAASLIGIVSEECRKNGGSRIEKVNIKIGRASGIMPDALIFAFEAIKVGSPAEHAILNIDEIPVGGLCSDCNKHFTVEEEYAFCCPLCGGGSFKITSGREMDIIDMEIS